MALLKAGRKGREEASAAACLNAEDHDELERARAGGLTADVERLIAKGRTARLDLGAAACLDDKDHIALESARLENRLDVVELLLEKARKALSDLGAVACLEPEDKIEYESALDEGRMGDVERLLEKARSLLGAKGGKAKAGVLQPQLSDAERKKYASRPNHIRSPQACQWGCSCKRGTLHGMSQHYRLVMAVLEAGGRPGVDTQCECNGPQPAPALCAVGGAVGTAAAASAVAL